MEASGLVLPWEIYPLIFLVAVLYSSVGHGGASGYLALFALFGVAVPAIAPIVLILNILVASTSFLRYNASGFFSAKKLLPFVCLSIPAAFVGGALHISPELYTLILGGALILSALRVVVLRADRHDMIEPPQSTLWKWGLPIGAVLGLISGMTGIGGGVFLSPVLLLACWADVKHSAALASAFIVLNSMSGLIGQLTHTTLSLNVLLPLVAVVITGGAIGSYAGAERLKSRWLQVILSIVLVIAGAKLILKSV